MKKLTDTVKEELALCSSKLTEVLDATLTGDGGRLAGPYAIAGLLAGGRHTGSSRSLGLESMLDAYYGTVLGPMIDQYRKLHAVLVKQKRTSDKAKYDLGRDTYVWAVRTRKSTEAPKKDATMDKLYAALNKRFNTDMAPSAQKREVRALVLETQRQRYIVVMNHEGRQWSMHIRQFWRDIDEALANETCLNNMDQFEDPQMLVAEDIVKLASQAADFSDDLPRVTDVQRPALSTYLEGNLWAGDSASSVGLQYGDARDPGFIASVRALGVLDLPEAKNGCSVPYGRLVDVTARLDYALEELVADEE